MSETIAMNGCKCVCDTASLLVEANGKVGAWGSGFMKIVEIGLLVLVIVLVLLGLYIGFQKIKTQSDEDFDNEQEEERFY